MSEPDLSTLPQRMRYAALVLEQADARYDGRGIVKFGWDRGSLLNMADKWEGEDEKRDSDAKELADILHQAHIRGDYDYYARQLIESGWHKRADS